MTLSWLISWRNLTRRKLRTAFTVMAIVIGVASTFAVTGTVNSTKLAVSSVIEQFDSIADFVIAGTTPTIDGSIVDELKEIAGVEAYFSQLYQPAQLVTSRLKPGNAGKKEVREGARVLLHGYDPMDGIFTNFRVLRGSLEKPGLVLPETAARIWNVDVGDEVLFEVNDIPRPVTVTAIVEDHERLNGPDDWQEAKWNRWDVALPLEMVQTFAGIGNRVRNIDVSAKAGMERQVEAELDERIAGRPDVFIEPVLLDEDALTAGLSDVYNGLYLLGSLGIMMSGIILYSTLYVSVIERKREFAIMKALGYTSWQTVAVVLRETILLALLGTAFGLLFGYGLSWTLSALMFDIFDIDAAVRTGYVFPLFLSLAVGIAVPLVSGIVPLCQTGRISVAQALKPVTVEYQKFRPMHVLFGLGLMIAGLWMTHPLRAIPLFGGILLVFQAIMIGLKMVVSPLIEWMFRFEGRLASSNVARQQNRAALASAILCTGVAFIVLVNFVNDAMMQSISETSRNYFGGDMKVRLSVPIMDQDVRGFLKLPGVKHVSTIREASVLWENGGKHRVIDVLSVSGDIQSSVPLFTARDVSLETVIHQLKKPKSVALGKALFEQWGGTVGDVIELETVHGRQRMTVRAVVDTSFDNGNVIFAHVDHFDALFGVDYAQEAAFILYPGADTRLLEERIFNQYQEKLSSIDTLEDFIENRQDNFSEPFLMMNVLLVLVMIVAGIGIMNTLQMNVMERIREIGMMRAVANTVWQVKKVILGEGLFIGLSGVLSGIGVGILVSYFTALFAGEMAGIRIRFLVPWPAIAMAIVFGLAVSAVSGIVPASRAAKVNLSEALKYE